MTCLLAMMHAKQCVQLCCNEGSAIDTSVDVHASTHAEVQCAVHELDFVTWLLCAHLCTDLKS